MPQPDEPRNGDYAAYIAALDKQRSTTDSAQPSAAANHATAQLNSSLEPYQASPTARSVPRQAGNAPMPTAQPRPAPQAGEPTNASNTATRKLDAQARRLTRLRRTRSLWLAVIGVVAAWHGLTQIARIWYGGPPSLGAAVPGLFMIGLGLILLRSALKLRRLARTNAPEQAVRGPNGDKPDPSGGG